MFVLDFKMDNPGYSSFFTNKNFTQNKGRYALVHRSETSPRFQPRKESSPFLQQKICL